MGNLNLEKGDKTSDINLQHEINQLFEEIKNFEKKYEIFDIEKADVKEQQIYFEPGLFEEFQPFDLEDKQIEAEAEILEEFQPIEDLEESKKPRFKFRIKKLDNRNEIEKGKIEKPINPTIFRFRYNNEGKFENIDLKKLKLKTKSKKPFILKRLNIRKKIKVDSEEKEISKFSKLKSVLLKLKRVIPNKSMENENPDEDEKENNFSYYN